MDTDRLATDILYWLEVAPKGATSYHKESTFWFEKQDETLYARFRDNDWYQVISCHDIARYRSDKESGKIVMMPVPNFPITVDVRGMTVSNKENLLELFASLNLLPRKWHPSKKYSAEVYSNVYLPYDGELSDSLLYGAAKGNTFTHSYKELLTMVQQHVTQTTNSAEELAKQLKFILSELDRLNVIAAEILEKLRAKGLQPYTEEH